MKTPQRPPATIDEYIALHADEVQAKLREIKEKVASIAPAAEQKISYGMPTFAMEKNIFHFAAFKAHIGLYPGPSAIEAFAADLQSYKTSKGAIQLPLDQKVPLGLIGKLVRFNVKTKT